MAHITTSVEYGVHCLLWLIGNEGRPLSSRDLAELQGVSPSFLAKIFPKLEKAGIVVASEGVHGGYQLARPPTEISFLDVVDAIEGEKPLFECQEVRRRCAVYAASPPGWATDSVCAVHAVMLQAERAMRDALAAQSLADVAARVDRKAPESFSREVNAWVGARMASRTAPSDKPRRG